MADGLLAGYLLTMVLSTQLDHPIIHTVGKVEREGWGLGGSPSVYPDPPAQAPSSGLLATQPPLTEFLPSAKHCTICGWLTVWWGHESKEVLIGVMSSKKETYRGPGLVGREDFLEEA